MVTQRNVHIAKDRVEYFANEREGLSQKKIARLSLAVWVGLHYRDFRNGEEQSALARSTV